MFEIHKSLCETHLIGPHCRESTVFHERCPILRTLHIENIGHSEIRPPYRMVRLDPTFSHIVACFGGRGRTLIEGRWKTWKTGEVLLTPPHALHAFESTGDKPWKIAWLFYEQSLDESKVGDWGRITYGRHTLHPKKCPLRSNDGECFAGPTQWRNFPGSTRQVRQLCHKREVPADKEPLPAHNANVTALRYREGEGHRQPNREFPLRWT